MAEHFTSSVALRDSLVKGDLDAFRAAAATLSDKELSANLSDAWKPHLEDMRTAAKRARDAKTIDTGARALADIGRACAGCHEKLGGPKLTVGEPPAPGSGAKPHMARHDWAAARMWEGLDGAVAGRVDEGNRGVHGRPARAGGDRRSQERPARGRRARQARARVRRSKPTPPRTRPRARRRSPTSTARAWAATRSSASPSSRHASRSKLV